VEVTAASADDGTKTPRVLGQLAHRCLSLLEVVRDDGNENNRALDRWLGAGKKPILGGVVWLPRGSEGFVVGCDAYGSGRAGLSMEISNTL
jgi:hypothetical protein